MHQLFFHKIPTFRLSRGTHCLRAVGGAFYSVINNLQSPLILLFLRCFDPDTNHIIAGFFHRLLSPAFIVSFYRQLFSPASVGCLCCYNPVAFFLQTIISHKRTDYRKAVPFLPFCRFAVLTFRFSSFVFRLSFSGERLHSMMNRTRIRSLYFHFAAEISIYRRWCVLIDI